MKLNSNFLASIRTFEASIRTNAIFVGISLILFNIKHINACKIILILSLFLNVVLSGLFIVLNYDKIKIFKENKILLNLYIPVSYSIILLITQILLLSVIFK